MRGQGVDGDSVAKWAPRMLALARLVSTWSHAPAGRQHGCVLAWDGRYVLSTGYNGPPPGEGYCECEGKPKLWCALHCKAVHAEVNAIANANRHLVLARARPETLVAFVTKQPCEPCMGAVRDCGARNLCYAVDDRPFNFAWVSL